MSRNRWDVLIGGAGMAASSAAIRLCALGFRPLLLTTKSHISPGVEALPEAGLALFKELGIEHLLREARSVVVEGFENRRGDEEIEVRSGSWVHLERSLLAKAAVREAVRRGTTLRLCQALPGLSSGPDSAHIVLDGRELHFHAALDATGRSAIWSRPIQRFGHQVADLYRYPEDSQKRGRIVRDADSWSYKLGLEHSGTLGIVTQDGKHRNLPDRRIRDAMGIASDSFEYVGRRPAFPQWCENSVHFRRLAIGDAALAYDPIAGQGICFALSSALAASATIKTWRDAPPRHEAANRFYRDFVDQRRRRHLEFLQRAQEEQPQPEPEPQRLPDVVVFAGVTETADVVIDSNVTTQDVLRLPDGARVRWLGPLDLLDIRNFAQQPIRSENLVNCLISPKCSREEVVACLQWCIQRRLLSKSPVSMAHFTS